MSDFPEFDAAYQTILIKDPNDKFEQLAAKAHFNLYHSDIWRGTARRFAESIVQECIHACPHEDARKYIRQHFGVES